MTSSQYIPHICARFITHLFVSPESPQSLMHSQANLQLFIAQTLRHANFHPSIPFAALILLQRLKSRFPIARCSSGHRIFIAALMIASKVIYDHTFSNETWTSVAQGTITLRELNQLEHAMLRYLNWDVTFNGRTLRRFEAMVRRDFRGPGPYPTYFVETTFHDI